MAEQVKIGDREYRFVSVHGRQLVKSEGDKGFIEFSAVRDDAAGTISVSDNMPLDCQLAEAARATIGALDAQRANAPRGVDGLPGLPLFGTVNARS